MVLKIKPLDSKIRMQTHTPYVTERIRWIHTIFCSR